MSVLRFLMLLSLVVWLGGIVFFASVVAPSAFAVLPTHQLAGNVVSRSLSILHWMGIVSGLVFAAASLGDARLRTGEAHPFTTQNLLICLMILLTLFSQTAIVHRMATLHADFGVIDEVPVGDLRRVEFNRLHDWSVRLEGAVLVLGLTVLYLTARKTSS